MKNKIIILALLFSGCSKSVTFHSKDPVDSFQKNNVSNVSLSSDGRILSITGVKLDTVKSIALYKIDGTTLIETLSIESQQLNLLTAKPRNDVILDGNDFILRIL